MKNVNHIVVKLLILISLTLNASADMLDLYMSGILPAITAKKSTSVQLTRQNVIDGQTVWRVDYRFDPSLRNVCTSFDDTNITFSIATTFIDGNATNVIPKTGYYINQYAHPYTLVGENSIRYVPVSNILTTASFENITQQSVDMNLSEPTGPGANLNLVADATCLDTIIPPGFVYDPCMTPGNCMDTTISGAPGSENLLAKQINDILLSQDMLNFYYKATGMILSAALDPFTFIHDTIGQMANLPSEQDPSLSDVMTQLESLDADIQVVTTKLDQIIEAQVNVELKKNLRYFAQLDAQINSLNNTFNSQIPNLAISAVASDQTQCQDISNFFIQTNLSTSDFTFSLLQGVEFLRTNFSTPASDGSILDALVKAKQKELIQKWPTLKTDSPNNTFDASLELDNYNKYLQAELARILVYLDYFYKFELVALYMADATLGCKPTFQATIYSNVGVSSDPYREKIIALSEKYDAIRKALQNYINSKMISDPIHGNNTVLSPEITTTWISPSYYFDDNVNLENSANKLLLPDFIGCQFYQYGGFKDFPTGDVPSGAFIHGSFDGNVLGNIVCTGNPESPSAYMHSNKMNVRWCDNNVLYSFDGQLTCPVKGFNNAYTKQSTTDINSGHSGWSWYEETFEDNFATMPVFNVHVDVNGNSPKVTNHRFTVPSGAKISVLEVAYNNGLVDHFVVGDGYSPGNQLIHTKLGAYYTVLYSFPNTQQDKLWFGIETNHWAGINVDNYRANVHCLKGSPSDVCRDIGNTGMLCLNDKVVLRPIYGDFQEYGYNYTTTGMQLNFYYSNEGSNTCSQAATNWISSNGNANPKM